MRLEGEHFSIRPVDEAREASAILEVYRQCEDFLSLGTVAYASPEMVQIDLDHSREEGSSFCGIYDRSTGAMMGIVDFMTAGFEGDPTLAFLSLLMIAAPFRGRGLGEEVVRAVESEIRRTGQARAIESGVQINNLGGIRFWQRMGYRIVSEPISFPDGTTVYRLWKDL